MTLSSLLPLLQLVSPALPVGAYTYSEGLEALVQANQIGDAATLEQWLIQEIRYGAIRLEAAVLIRAYQCVENQDLPSLKAWNQWLSALRETEELRAQSWQMGRSLSRLLGDLQPQTQPLLSACGEPANFATIFAIAAVSWQIKPAAAVLGYLYSWTSNLVNAGVRLIPLGQTQGQQILTHLISELERASEQIPELKDEQLECCSWGVSIASMNHETLYSRLFRS